MQAFIHTYRCAATGSTCEGFAAAPNQPWPSAMNVEGHIRSSGNFSYATVLRTGHLVPTVVPDVFARLLEMVLT